MSNNIVIVNKVGSILGMVWIQLPNDIRPKFRWKTYKYFIWVDFMQSNFV